MRKVEIDVTKEPQVRHATEFIIKYEMPAIVVAPELVTTASVVRSLLRGRHRIFVMVDWPKGSQHLSDKFRGMPSDSLNADGFEILLTPGTAAAIKKEVKFLSQFFRDHFPPTVELRPVLGWFGQDRAQEHYLHMLEALRIIPNPQMVRTTHLTKLSINDGALESHRNIIRICKRTVKISGNIDSFTYMGCGADLYACNFEQARALQKELSSKGAARIHEEIAQTRSSESPDSDPPDSDPKSPTS